MVATPSLRDGSDNGQADALGTPPGSARPCSETGAHRLSVVGYLLGPRPTWLDCLKPLRVVCRDCEHETRWACAGHRESVCKPCAARYRRRVRRVAESGTARATGYQYLLTCTAPGRDRHRMPSGDWCPCTPAGGVDLARWNAGHSARWNHLRTLMRRELSPAVEYFRGVEVQERGALHDHAMVWSPVPLSKNRLRGMAMRAGFGHSLDLAPAPPGSKRAAYYVSKYVTKATDSRELVPWWGEVVDLDSGEVTEGVIAGRYRTWSMSRGWGLTMAAVRAYVRADVLAREAALSAQTFDMVVRAFDCVPIGESPPPAPS